MASRYDPLPLRRLTSNDEVVAGLRDWLTLDVMNEVLVQIGKKSRELSEEYDIPYAVAELYLVGLLLKAAGALRHWKAGEVAAEAFPQSAIAEPLDYRGGTGNIKRVFPALDQIAKSRQQIQESGKPQTFQIDGWNITMSPIDPTAS